MAHRTALLAMTIMDF